MSRIPAFVYEKTSEPAGVASLDEGAILTAPDGLNWTTRSVNATGYVERVIFANNRFVGVGEDGLIVTSPDGTNWTKVPAISPADLEGIAYGNGVYVAVGGYFAKPSFTIRYKRTAIRFVCDGSVVRSAVSLTV